MRTHEAVFSHAVEQLRSARRVVVFTGSGISAESGISTFRDPLHGLWAKFDPAQLATPAAFRKDPALVWGWYEWRRAQVARSVPNAGHRVIAALRQCVPDVVVVTQNVDDLHERAGSEGVIHLHGSLNAARCFACARPWRLDPCDGGEATATHLEPPRCSHCNGRIRPGVVWFGEELPQAPLKDAINAAKACDVLISIGTSGLVYPAAQIPGVAQQQGATVVHINTQPVEGVDDGLLLGTASEWLTRLLSAAFGQSVGH